MIGRFWHWLTDTHQHHWETLDVQQITAPQPGLAPGRRRVGFLYILRCKDCGKINFQRTGLLS